MCGVPFTGVFVFGQDMEKWAKTLNAQKDSQSVNKKLTAAAHEQRKETASADAGFAMLEHVGVSMHAAGCFHL